MKKKILTLIIAIVSFCGLHAQGTQAQHPAQAQRTYEYLFRNVGSTFHLNTVGNIIIKESKTNDVRCVVNVVAYGNSQTLAEERLKKIHVEPKGKNTLDVTASIGLLNKKHYNITTTVYLPNTVNLQHNDNANIDELFYRFITKLRLN